MLDIGIDSLVHKAGEFLGNKTAATVIKSSGDKIVKQEFVEEVTILPEQRDGILNKLRQILL